jgi:hypothetical protein
VLHLIGDVGHAETIMAYGLALIDSVLEDGEVLSLLAAENVKGHIP